MTDEELIARLRDWPVSGMTNHAAADRIEALVKQLAEADALIEAQAKDHASNNIRLAETAHRAERLEAALKWQAEQPEAHPFMVAQARAALNNTH